MHAPPLVYRAALMLGMLLIAASSTAQVTVNVQFAASAAGLSMLERSQIESHTRQAVLLWTNELALPGPRMIEVEIAVDEGIPRATGGSVTSAFVGKIGARDMFEQGVAAELRTGIDPNGVDPDARFTFNTTYLRNELWFDPDPLARSAVVPIDRTDAFSVFLHEFGHAIAYNGWADGQGMFPATFFSTFDRWMIAGTPTVFDGPVSVEIWGSQPDLTTNNIHHWGNGTASPVKRTHQAVLWDGGRPIPHAACEGLPSAGAPPSANRDRWKGGAPSLIDELMNGVVFFRGQRYDLSALDLAVLSDLGLPVLTATIFADGFES